MTTIRDSGTNRDGSSAAPKRQWLVPTKRWQIGPWKVKASRSHPPRPWKPRLQRGGTILARTWSFRWLTVCVWGTRWR